VCFQQDVECEDLDLDTKMGRLLMGHFDSVGVDWSELFGNFEWDLLLSC
jgi:hypothetical protein